MYMIAADLPGLRTEDVKIDLHDRVLRISGERTREKKEDLNNYYERSSGRFVRSFTLPESVDAKKVEAHFENGVLRILLPKTEIQATQEVKIQSGKTEGSLLDRFLRREKSVPTDSPPAKASETTTDKAKH